MSSEKWDLTPFVQLSSCAYTEVRYTLGGMALNDQRFHILVALANGPMHGYGVAEEICLITDGALSPRAGSLYHALDKLVDQQLVEVDREEVVDSRMRRYYKLTGLGSETLSTEARQRQHSATVALDRLNIAFAGFGGAT